jgi:hypothetical protein
MPPGICARRTHVPFGRISMPPLPEAVAGTPPLPLLLLLLSDAGAGGNSDGPAHCSHVPISACRMPSEPRVSGGCAGSLQAAATTMAGGGKDVGGPIVVVVVGWFGTVVVVRFPIVVVGAVGTVVVGGVLELVVVVGRPGCVPRVVVGLPPVVVVGTDAWTVGIGTVGRVVGLGPPVSD